MHRWKFLLVGFLIVAGAAAVVGTASAVTASFSNPTNITINDGGACGLNDESLNPAPATPYPSPIVVSGVVGNINDVNVSITSLSHTWPDDVGLLLVGPTGARSLLMADAGDGAPVSLVNLTFDQQSGAVLPDNGQIVSGTFRPSVYSSGFPFGCIHPASFPAPAPAGPYGATLNAFNGTNPNGVWNLFVIDDTGFDVGSINGGWSLTISTATGTLTVNKMLVSNPLDPGKFNLLVDGVTKAACVGNNGTTGPLVVLPGGHTISETACFGTNLGNYVTSITCDNGFFSWGTSIFVFVNTGEDVTCTIKNQRKLFKV
jgi:subtilisin-like proprotein convertase family protein